MLRLKDSQLTFWDAMLPAELLELKEELAKVDAILDDEDFLAPFIERFNTRIGRPTVPVETYLRLMYLKFRYQLGYEALVEEVKDSIQWRYFCRISTLEFKLARAGVEEGVSPEKIREALNSLNFAEVEIEGRKLLIKTKGTELSSKILRTLRIKHPKNVSTPGELSL